MDTNEEITDGEETTTEETEENNNEDFSEDGEQTNWKAEALKLQGINKRLKTKIDKFKEEPTQKQTKKTDDFDYGQKAYLVANGVKGTEEMELAKTYMRETGKSLDEVLESKHFMSELKDLRDTKQAQNAMPTKSGRSSMSTSDSVDYWIAKGELPPTDNPQLRREVVNARIKQEQSTSRFSDTPVVR